MTKSQRNSTRQPALTARQEIAALSLSMGCFIGQAARQAKVSTDGVKRWLREVPAFRRRIEELRSQATERAMAVLTEAACEASLKMLALMRHSDDQRIQLRAAEAIQDHQLRYREQVTLSERLRVLEEQLAAQTTPRVPRIA